MREPKLWLWKNFVDGRPEYWAFDNPYPCHPNCDPITLGEPCGYAIFKPSTLSRSHLDWTDEQVLRAVAAAQSKRRLAPELEAEHARLRDALKRIAAGGGVAATWIAQEALASNGDNT